ncbi:lysophospholipid acyltransferase family protein [Nitrosomonas sp.]|uniref:lysophospholipid acyltransferase family protein n=1 Tax=Nitrosomonas sp. TaxID=42353 RepID=UPI002607F0FF|nr:lysophospholipid acyltransferase family protein [Nitrosomonas sp.]
MITPAANHMNSAKTSYIIRLFRLARLLLHILSGLLQSFVYPHFNRTIQRRMARKWANNFLAILNIKLICSGILPAEDEKRVILVANHISWLDIMIIMAKYPVRFVAKAEILGWPLLNLLCRNVGTIFIEREKRNDTLRVNQDIVRALDSGDSIAIFPEGATSDGTVLLHFHASLLQSAVNVSASLFPVAICYRDSAGIHNTKVAYANITIIQSLKQILEQPFIQAELYFLDSITSDDKNRRELARLSEQAISETLQLSVVRKAPERSADLPVE